MDHSRFNRQKLYALIAAIVGILSCLLPWWSFGLPGYEYTVSGLHGLGFLVFIAFIAAAAMIYGIGEHYKPLEGNTRLYTSIAFGVAALVTLIQLVRQTYYATFGIWLSLLAAIAGGIVAVGYVALGKANDVKT